MTQARFTPGPWQINGCRHKGDLKMGPKARLHFVGPDGDAVAAVFYDMETGKGFPDAKLIAAAPAMYDALRAFADLKEWDEREPINATGRQMMAAIRLAEGTQ